MEVEFSTIARALILDSVGLADPINAQIARLARVAAARQRTASAA